MDYHNPTRERGTHEGRRRLSAADSILQGSWWKPKIYVELFALDDFKTLEQGL